MKISKIQGISNADVASQKSSNKVLGINSATSNSTCNLNNSNYCIKTYIVPFMGKKFLSAPTLAPDQIKELKDNESKNPLDIQYKEKMLTALGLNKKDTFILSSIVGSNEFQDIAEQLDDNSGNPDIAAYAKGEGNKNILNYDYKANFHIHTDCEASDGSILVPDLLNQAAEYADNMVEKKGKGNFFYIAITDHNTVESCEEALRVMSSDPWKYRNIKLVLGTELSLNIGHTTALCLNPFDKELQKYYKTRENKRFNIIWKVFDIEDDEFYKYANEHDVVGAIAHPAISFHMDENNPKVLSPKMTDNMITSFIRFKSELKLAFIEGHCQRYGFELMNTPEGKEYRKNILLKAKEIGLKSIGGNDNHSRNVFNVKEAEYAEILKHLRK